MKPIKHYAVALAFGLLNVVLPKSIKADICGDLQEEFEQLQQNPTNQINALQWLWLQTFSCSWRFIMTKQRIYSLIFASICCLIVFMLLVAINFLSVTESSAFTQAYWTNGHIHQLFFEPALWQSLNNGFLNYFNVMMIMDPRSIIYAVVSFTVIFLLDKKYTFSSSAFALIALVLLALPYIGGFVYFQLNDVALDQSGPIIALMWLSILYLMPSLTYRLISKRHQLA